MVDPGTASGTECNEDAVAAFVNPCENGGRSREDSAHPSRDHTSAAEITLRGTLYILRKQADLGSIWREIPFVDPSGS